MHIKVFKDKHGEWRWRLIARNQKIVACSGEGYKRRHACWAMAVRILRVS